MKSLKPMIRVLAFLAAAVVIPACVVEPGGAAAGGGGGPAPAGGGGNPLAGNWSGNWTNDGSHSLAFTVDGSGKVTGGSLVHPGSVTDQVTGGSLSLTGSSVTGQLTFDGFFQSVTFVFSSTNYTPPGMMTGTLSPGSAYSGLMSGGGPVSLNR